MVDRLNAKYGRQAIRAVYLWPSGSRTRAETLVALPVPPPAIGIQPFSRVKWVDKRAFDMLKVAGDRRAGNTKFACDLCANPPLWPNQPLRSMMATIWPIRADATHCLHLLYRRRPPARRAVSVSVVREFQFIRFVALLCHWFVRFFGNRGSAGRLPWSIRPSLPGCRL